MVPVTALRGGLEFVQGKPINGLNFPRISGKYLDEPTTGRARTALARLRSGSFFHKIGFGTSVTAVKSDSNKFVIFRFKVTGNAILTIYVSEELLTGQRLPLIQITQTNLLCQSGRKLRFR